VLRQPDILAGLAGAIAVAPPLALAPIVLRDRARRAFAAGAEAVGAALVGAAIVAGARGGAASWRGVTAVETAANAVLALACLCAVVPPLRARFGSTRSATALAGLAGGAIALRGGLALAVHAGLAARADATRLVGVALGAALVCAVAAALISGVRRASPRVLNLASPWLVVACGVTAVSTFVALLCAESGLLPIQLRAPAGSTFLASGTTSETLFRGLTGVAHVVPRAQVGAIVVALAVGAMLAAWQTRHVAPPREADVR
jgi:hypothetical protein